MKFYVSVNSGFTLIELIVVIAIIAILAAIIAPNAFRAIEKSKISATIADYKAIKTAAMAYYADTGTWPADAVDGATTSGFVINDGRAGWDGSYLEKWPPTTRWGGTYVFQNDSGRDWSGDGSGDAARYLQVGQGHVPRSVAAKIDIQLDGINNALARTVHYAAAHDPCTVWILISTEVVVRDN